MLGTTIKDFKLVERLGKGGWGEVWAGEQQLIKTRVAIKLLDSEVSRDQLHVERFFNEAIAAGKIPHAGIVKIFDVGFYNEQAFLIMELLAGETLAARIRRVTRMSLEGMIEISRQISGVLAATHDSGITHRDLKPDNVFLIPDAEMPSRERVKILDFGIAKLGNSTSGNTDASSMGTPAYMAPEQWRDAGSADSRADIYSLGCVMFEMCCGRPPFVATSTAEACTQHLEVAPPRAKSIAPGLPSMLDDLIDRMLAKSPDDRPSLVEISRTLENSRPSADTLLAPLSIGRAGPRAVVPVTVTSLAGAVMPKPKAPPRSKKRGLVIAAVAVVALGGIGTAAVVRATRSEASPPELGLQAIEDYREPKPDTIGNRRSDALWSAALDDFSRACKQTDADARWCAGERFAAGQLALIRDDIPGAISAFRSATMIDNGWATAQVALSYSLAYSRDLEGALAAARRAQALEPHWWQAAAASARAYVSAGPVEDSLIEYRRALSLSPPNNAVLLSEVALAYHFARQDGEATKLAAQADALDHSLVGIHVMRSERALEVDNAQVALQEADLALAVSPKNGAALLARGDALALAGQRADAIAVYRRAIALKGGLNILAISEVRLARIEAALAAGTLPPPRSRREVTPSSNQQDSVGPAGNPPRSITSEGPRTPAAPGNRPLGPAPAVKAERTGPDQERGPTLDKATAGSERSRTVTDAARTRNADGDHSAARPPAALKPVPSPLAQKPIRSNTTPMVDNRGSSTIDKGKNAQSKAPRSPPIIDKPPPPPPDKPAPRSPPTPDNAL